MRFKIVLFTLLFSLSHVAHANLVNWDAFSSGDGLAVKDQSTGLIWLDLSQSAGLSYIDAGTKFEGWGYAGYEVVEALLNKALPSIVTNVSQNFQQRCPNTTKCFSEALEWQTLFGSTIGARSYQTHSFGLYQDQNRVLRMGGSYLNGSGSANLYGTEFNVDYTTRYTNSTDSLFSTFLIKNSNMAKNAVGVDEPSSLILFSLLILFLSRRQTC